RGVQPASLGESFLGCAQPCRQKLQKIRRYRRIRFYRWKMLMHRVNGRLATQAAARGGKHVARERLKINLHSRREKNIQRIFRSVAFETGSDFDNLLAALDQAFGKQKT